VFAGRTALSRLGLVPTINAAFKRFVLFVVDKVAALQKDRAN